MSCQALDELKQQIPLRDYLQAHDWQPARTLSRGRFMGLCPLHEDHEPSFLVDPLRNLFYCYGCGRGGDVIRFAELYHLVTFRQGLAFLRQWRGLPPLLRAAADLLWPQFVSHGAASSFLARRQGWLVLVGAGPAMPGGYPRRGSVRLCRLMAGRFS